MAITKIHAIKATVDKAIDYICNPDKTDDKLYISSFACAPETAAIDFKYTLDHTHDLRTDSEDNENKAFHLIQAFAPGEVSFEEAHTIGKELAQRLLQGQYSYVLTTHIDKGHVHNHLIFCAADNINHEHYHDCKKSYYNIRNLNDTLCKEHGLSVIEPDERRGKKYNEWQAEKDGDSWKNQIRKDINICIRAAKSYEEFLLLLKARGYEIKGETVGADAPKYISFRPIGKDRFVRGTAKSLGKKYTKENIQKRIEQKKERSTLLSPNDKKLHSMIDLLNDPKFTENAGLKRWGTKENLKIAAKTFSLMTSKKIHSFAELDNKIDTIKRQSVSANDGIKSLEAKLRDLAEIIKYAEQYQEYKPYNDRYESVNDKDRFLRKYESQIILFGGAERMLQRKSIRPGAVNVAKLKVEYKRLNIQREELNSSYKGCQKELKELDMIQQNMAQFLQMKQEQEIRQNPSISKENEI